MKPIEAQQEVIVKRLNTDAQPVETDRKHLRELGGIGRAGVCLAGGFSICVHFEVIADRLKNCAELHARQVGWSAASKEHSANAPAPFAWERTCALFNVPADGIDRPWYDCTVLSLHVYIEVTIGTMLCAERDVYINRERLSVVGC